MTIKSNLCPLPLSPNIITLDRHFGSNPLLEINKKINNLNNLI